LGGFLGRGYLRERAERGEALDLAADKRFDEALPLLLRLHERDPDDVAVVRALALGHIATHQVPEAEAFLDRWCALRPDTPEPFRLRFDLEQRLHKVGQAITDAEALLRFKPDDYPTRKTLAELLLLNGDSEGAEKEARRCYQARRDDVDVWFLLAKALHAQKHDDQAAVLTDQVLRKQPDLHGAVKLRADLYFDAGQPDAALRLLRQSAAAPGPDAYARLFDLSVGLARAGRGEEADAVVREAQWHRALELWTEDEDRDRSAPLQGRVVEAYLAAGKADDAVRFLTDILKRNPNADPGTRRLLADCYEKQGKPELAAEQRRRADTKP
jgi:predicted Zn-dependent protease